MQDDYKCKVELSLSSDGRTIVCYHLPVNIPYEHTKPIPRPDPVHNNEETHDQVLKSRLEEKSEHLEQEPMIEQLSKMFFTTKHRWFPHGQYHRRRKKLDPPKTDDIEVLRGIRNVFHLSFKKISCGVFTKRSCNNKISFHIKK
ncbi:39S ribosomal protein L42, mitochondrial-like [Tupaia chinensis]|uniref:39S ribosomal protein L42, mitochondrial-like n=1 Tax=Tupaia chinensis TaxID=246437 RepID=UPI0003C8CBCB|nr:39S ribosomal protein L42, mitochondrial-like [Tupaia chinensis]XP_006150103.1 39S ribosomal protein L42, mitochondrial-like [Tupaia chinensis]